jgi:hypothetical protein
MPIYEVLLAILGLMGGLFTPLSAGAKLIVSFFVKPGFTSFMTKNLFLMSKYKDQ